MTGIKKRQVSKSRKDEPYELIAIELVVEIYVIYLWPRVPQHWHS